MDRQRLADVDRSGSRPASRSLCRMARAIRDGEKTLPSLSAWAEKNLWGASEEDRGVPPEVPGEGGWGRGGDGGRRLSASAPRSHRPPLVARPDELHNRVALGEAHALLKSKVRGDVREFVLKAILHEHGESIPSLAKLGLAAARVLLCHGRILSHAGRATSLRTVVAVHAPFIFPGTPASVRDRAMPSRVSPAVRRVRTSWRVACSTAFGMSRSPSRV